MTTSNMCKVARGGLLVAALLAAYPSSGWSQEPWNRGPRRGPDLVVSRLTHNPAQPVVNQTITFTAVVKNVGVHKSKPSRLSFRVGGETPPARIFAVPGLAPNEEFIVTRQLALNVPQAYQNTAIADYDDRVNETNEQNNVRMDRFLVRPEARPDLIVAALTHSPAQPVIHQVITFTAVVMNVGAGVSPPSMLSFRVGGETPPAQVFSVPALAPGARFAVTRRLPLDVAQNYRNTAIADYDNRVFEMDETNNQRTDDYSVSRYSAFPVR